MKFLVRWRVKRKSVRNAEKLCSKMAGIAFFIFTRQRLLSAKPGLPRKHVGQCAEIRRAVAAPGASVHTGKRCRPD